MMRLTKSLLRLNKRFCAETIAEEIAALPASAWIPHPGNYRGNDAVPLVTPDGTITNAFTGPMAATEHLRQCPYIMEVMADIGAVWGRSRLMGLAPGAEVPNHVDANYYWRTHMRVHIPVITNPGVTFHVEDDSVHMAPGECWVFDSFKTHNVQNRGTAKRIHLVLDTVGGEAIWDLIDEAERSAINAAKLDPLPPGRGLVAPLKFEQLNDPGIMSPWEIRCHTAFVAEHAPKEPMVAAAFRRMERFAEAWTGLWAQFGPSDEGLPSYRRLLNEAQRDLQLMPGAAVRLPNAIPVFRALDELIFRTALPAGQAQTLRPAVGDVRRAS